MKWSDLPLHPTPRMLRQFAAALLVFLALDCALFPGVLRHPAGRCVIGALAVMGVAGLALPALIRWLFIGATVAAFPIGWVVSQVMLALMFYVILTPLALVFRWRRRDELQLRRPPGDESRWTTRDAPPKPERYLKQF